MLCLVFSIFCFINKNLFCSTHKLLLWKLALFHMRIQVIIVLVKPVSCHSKKKTKQKKKKLYVKL